MQEYPLDSFDAFLAISREQSEPQRLLLVLARKELPEGHTAEQARQFEAGEGGHLAPLAAVDKTASELQSFSSFSSEAGQIVDEWDAVFVAALPGIAGQAPTAKAVDEAVEKMLHAIRNGMIAGYLVFDREGRPLQISAA